MAPLKIINVRGDGHCYYRCIWRVAKDNAEIAEALMIYDLVNEDDGMQEVRDCVARYFRFDYTTHDIIQSVLEFKRAVDIDISGECPLYSHINVEKDLAWNCNQLADVIEFTNTMASSTEHEVIMRAFAEIDIGMIVLAHLTGEDKEDLADKWLRQLSKYIPTIPESKVCILINEDNIHYKYCKVFGKTVVSKVELAAYIDRKMSESTDDDDEEN